MSDRDVPAPSSPALLGAEPELFVSDMKAACDFFIRKLGFKTEFLYGEPPFYGQMSRGGARINLRYLCEPVFVDRIRERDYLLSARSPSMT